MCKVQPVNASISIGIDSIVERSGFYFTRRASQASIKRREAPEPKSFDRV